jgi:hypothetical protein
MRQMMNHRSFGRRGVPQHAPVHAIGVPETSTQNGRVDSTERSFERPVLMSDKTDLHSLNDELGQWKLARKRNLVHWRSLWFVATLSFGIASFVLPDSVNDNVNWVLYGLAAASVYVGFRKRHQQTKS